MAGKIAEPGRSFVGCTNGYHDYQQAKTQASPTLIYVGSGFCAGQFKTMTFECVFGAGLDHRKLWMEMQMKGPCNVKRHCGWSFF
jgi:hypothetical protein